MSHLMNGKHFYYFNSLQKSSKCLSQLRQLSSEEPPISSFTSSRVDETEQRVVKKPVSYLPDHLPQLRKRIKQKPWWKYRFFISINALPKDERPVVSETPQYPPIVDNSKEGIAKRVRLNWYSAIKRLPTAQQKQYEISKHYAHLSFILEPVLKQYNSLPLQKFITRTHLISGQLPSIYDDINVDSLLDNNLKQSIVDTIALHLFETKQRRPTIEFKTTSLPLMGFPTEQMRVNTAKEEDTIEGVVGLIRKALNRNYEHLNQFQLDLSPYVCTSWWHNRFPPPFTKKRWFSDEIDQSFTYKATHSLHLRAENPLPKILSFDDEICTKCQIPEYKHKLLDMGFQLKRHNLSMLPGFWSDRSGGFDFPYLIGLTRQDLKLREHKNEKSFSDTQDVLDGMAIMSSFAWLHGLASNLGFSLYHELTYPLVTQVIITDGQYWSFYVYQLNTHCFHSDVDNNLLRNVCWSSGDMKLFDTYEGGQLTGVNDNVLKTIVKFLIREPQLTEDCNLRPYLSEDNRNKEDVEELSYVLRRKYHNYHNSFVSARQRVHLWEKIYKYHKDAIPTPHLRQRPKMNFRYPPFFTR